MRATEEVMWWFAEAGDYQMGDTLIDANDNTHWLVCDNGEDAEEVFLNTIKPIKDIPYCSHTRPSLLSLHDDIKDVQESLNICLKSVVVNEGKGLRGKGLRDFLDHLCAQEKFLVGAICKRVMTERTLSETT